jgi:hypothetical protein
VQECILIRCHFPPPRSAPRSCVRDESRWEPLVRLRMGLVFRAALEQPFPVLSAVTRGVTRKASSSAKLVSALGFEPRNSSLTRSAKYCGIARLRPASMPNFVFTSWSELAYNSLYHYTPLRVVRGSVTPSCSIGALLPCPLCAHSRRKGGHLGSSKADIAEVG